jgi:hypothetical protein
LTPTLAKNNFINATLSTPLQTLSTSPLNKLDDDSTNKRKRTRENSPKRHFLHDDFVENDDDNDEDDTSDESSEDEDNVENV